MTRIKYYFGYLIILVLVGTLRAQNQGEGYGANPGGLGGDSVTVSNLSDFRKYSQSSLPYIIGVAGTIDFGGYVRISGNKTIYGLDATSTIIGEISINDVKNVIIRNLNITNHVVGGDGISLRNSTNVFITHCTVYDCTDGLIDITRASDFVTVSYCKFYYKVVENHKFPNLIGASDTDFDDRGKLHVTMHHNWWAEGCTSRMPNLRFGKVHMYNNYFTSTGNNYCSRARIEAQILSEYNFYNQVRDPLIVEEGGIAKSIGNIYYECTNNIYSAKDDVFTPEYEYTVTSAECAQMEVMTLAGNTPASRVFMAGLEKLAADTDPVRVGDSVKIQYKWSLADSAWISGTLPESFFASLDRENQTLTLYGVATAQGEYIVNISTYGCAQNITLTDTLIIASPLSTEQMSFFELEAYPNPFTNRLRVESQDLIKIQILDLTGSQVINTSQTEIDMSGVRDGVYILRAFRSNGSVATKRVIKRRNTE